MSLLKKNILKIIGLVIFIIILSITNIRECNAKIKGTIKKDALLEIAKLRIDKKTVMDHMEACGNYKSYVESRKVNGIAYGIIDLAYDKIGSPYVWGATGPDAFDCSGFIEYIFSSYGIDLPRTAACQYYAGVNVSMDQLQDGDLVFFNTYTILGHVGMYIGSGNFIHAADDGVKISSLYEEYYSNAYSGATRIIY